MIIQPVEDITTNSKSSLKPPLHSDAPSNPSQDELSPPDSGVDSPKHSDKVTGSDCSETDSDSDSSDSSGSDSDECVTDGVVGLTNTNGFVPKIGNLVIDSNEVQIGNRTIYHGPVTIKQVVYPAAVKALDDKLRGGIDNPGYEKDVCDSNNEANSRSDVVKEEHDSSDLKKELRCSDLLPKSKRAKIVLFVTILLLSSLITVLVLMLKNQQWIKPQPQAPGSLEGEVLSPIQYESDLPNNTISNILRIVSRGEWLSQPAAAELNDLKTPVSYVIIQHTATENCTSQAQCTALLRNIQSFHIDSRSFDDIAYNFLVGGDGNAYEGRGWTKEGAHTRGWNVKSIGIAFIGTFTRFKPPQMQIDVCKKVIAKGVENGYIEKDYKVLAARQLQATESPGMALYNDIKTWEHWSEHWSET